MYTLTEVADVMFSGSGPFWLALSGVIMLLSIAKSPVLGAMDKGADTIQGLLDALSEAMEGLANRTASGRGEADQHAMKLMRGIKVLLDYIIAGLSSVVDALTTVVEKCLDILTWGESKDLLPWRILGSQLQLLVLAMIIYADLVMGANAYSVLLGGSIQVPPIFQRFEYALMAAFTGTFFGLGLLAFDFFNLTHFSPLNVKLNKAQKVIVAALILLTLVGELYLAVMIGAERRAVLMNAEPGIMEAARAESANAQVYIVIPMLLTTLVMGWGATGIIVYVVLAGLIVELAFRLLRFLFGLVRAAFGVTEAGAGSLLSIIFVITRLVFGTFAWVAAQMAMIVHNVALFLQAVVEIATYVPLLIATVLASAARRISQMLASMIKHFRDKDDGSSGGPTP